MALDSSAHAYRFDGKRWTSSGALGGEQGLGSQLASVSCTSTTFCEAVPPGSDAVVAWNGASWSGPDALSANNLQAVSCVGESFCATVDGEGNAYVFDGTGWARGSGDWGGVAGISCVTPGFCVSVSGGISQFNGSTWTQPDEYGATANLVGVSCVSVSSCLTVDTLDQALEYTGTWSSPAPIGTAAGGAGGNTAPTGVSCWAAASCVVVDTAGNATVLQGAWHAPVVVDRGHVLNAVSCAGVLCVAVDDSGDAVMATR